MGPITEVLDDGEVPLWRHPEWRARFPWLQQGITGRGSGSVEFDLGLFGEVPVGEVLGRWRQLRKAMSMASAVHSRQVHGTTVREWIELPPPGLVLIEGYDAHVTRSAGVLLSVSVADCVPVFVVAEPARAIALAHAGWRGIAAGVVERAVSTLVDTTHSSPADLWLHCGPSICGTCYEVGSEVHNSINPEIPAPDAPTPIDLCDAIGQRAERVGVPAAQMTASTHCTRCRPELFFSHRAGSPGRQIGVLGIRR